MHETDSSCCFHLPSFVPPFWILLLHSFVLTRVYQQRCLPSLTIIIHPASASSPPPITSIADIPRNKFKDAHPTSPRPPPPSHHPARHQHRTRAHSQSLPPVRNHGLHKSHRLVSQTVPFPSPLLSIHPPFLTIYTTNRTETSAY